MKQVQVEITGISPLIQHNGEGANPLDDRKLPDFLSKEIGYKTIKEASKAMVNKRKKTDKDHEILSKIGFYSSLYLSNTGKVLFPAECFYKAIETQAKSLKKGNLIRMGVNVLSDTDLCFPNKDKSLESLYSDHAYKAMVRVGMSKTLRTRAIFPEWSAIFKVEYNPITIEKGELKSILDLGKSFGCMERRPKFGRYKVVKFSD